MPRKWPANDLDEPRPGTRAEWERYKKWLVYGELISYFTEVKNPHLNSKYRRAAPRLKLPYGYRDWSQFDADAKAWLEGFLS